MAVQAVDLDRVSALERGADELDVLQVPRVVVQGHIDHVRSGHRCVERHDQDAGVLRFLDDAVQRIRGVGIQQDDVHALRGEVTDDVRLLGGVPVGDVVHELVVRDRAVRLVLGADRVEGVDHDVSPGSPRGTGADADHGRLLRLGADSERAEGEHHGEDDENGPKCLAFHAILFLLRISIFRKTRVLETKLISLPHLLSRFSPSSDQSRTSVGKSVTTALLALSRRSLSRVRPRFAPSVTAPRRLRTFFASPILATTRPAAA